MTFTNKVIFCEYGDDYTKLILLEKYDFTVFKILKLEKRVFLFANLIDGLYFYNPNYNEYFIINHNYEIEHWEDSKIPEYKWSNNLILLLNNLENGYEIKEQKGNKLMPLAIKENIKYKWIKNGILEYYNDTSRNNWLRLLDPATGNEIWLVDYPKKIDYVNDYDGVIVFNYIDYRVNPSETGWDTYYHIALDAQTGQELWRLERKYGWSNYVIDKDHNALLCMQVLDQSKIFGNVVAAQALEVDLLTGKYLSSPTVRLMEHHGFEPKFVDETAFYYTNHLGSFGKIRKTDGLVEWEFDLIDEKGSKRKVQDWLKLGNGKFVLQTPPNHKNGDFSCIFDPAENIEYASVVNGVRLKEALKPSRR